ncbi:LYR motif-containing protein 2 CYBJADRAFT_175346 [Cyberlindnera jadinii NRRL Y-1542]|uniref:LYR motif-containing protein 2 n=1 Tax=Cyberlindnera jadinii (strain ATCC 18201 / CBS 1600 / BCRC 20928 / JCM 3617 / NBRC 0987 / NRRL Y-1542) TaxID=983966 RepID=A0A1E4RVI2_CYBJN|nr:hypothetical protein CYBJADRAFT_175346 [Cyberlindnera jadinii NRRL Y-1542]ODV71211.1 hypothetical protein CYBJADRAFT_175346 [Cyberlindnera jadinii NRRL Y-1542]
MSRKLGLKEFMHNQEVLRFYRQVLRDIRKAPVDQQAELLSYVKHEFRSSAPTLDANKYLMSNGKQQYSIMKRALGIS